MLVWDSFRMGEGVGGGSPCRSAESASQRRVSLRLLGGWQLVDNGTELRLSHREQRLVALLGLRGERARAARRRRPVARQHRRASAREPAPGGDADPTCSSWPVARRARLRRAGPGDRGRRGGGLSRRRGLRDFRSPTTSSPTCSPCSAVRSCCPAGTTTGSSPSARASSRCVCVPSTGSRGRRWTGETWCSPSRPLGQPSDIEPHSEPACEVALRAHLARGDLAGVVVGVPTLSRSHVGQRRGRPVGPDPGARRVRRRDVRRRGRHPRVGRTSTGVPSASVCCPARATSSRATFTSAGIASGNLGASCGRAPTTGLGSDRHPRHRGHAHPDGP